MKKSFDGVVVSIGDTAGYRELPYIYRGKEKTTGHWVYGYAVSANKILAGGEFVEIIPDTLGIKISSVYDDEIYTGDMFCIKGKKKQDQLVVALYNSVYKAVCLYEVSWSNVYEKLELMFIDTMEYVSYKQKLGKVVGNIFDNFDLIPDGEESILYGMLTGAEKIAQVIDNQNHEKELS